ncbi:hypothetical protein GE061_004693 [Apolygus lucorum]|uniref:Lipase n=1 Tax=Apolygus lucorum TaxID=248454 RepID=A0A8S9X3X1_APOLU|nr:hypothetical protein GE061_004693 [Apolygus lucorum]
MMHIRWLFFISIFSIIVSISSGSKWTPPETTPFPNITDQNVLFKLIDGIGLKKEVYKIATEDGYILCLTRLVLPENKNKKNKGIPLLMVNGLFLHSDAWLMHADPLNNPAIHFLTHGYDVWLGDQRGASRSRGHKEYNHMKDLNYWVFTFHETGIYDLPAFIDFILRKTGHKKIGYAGLSLGTTFCFVLLSEKPEYNEKIYLAILFVPVGDMPVLSTRGLGTQIVFNFLMNLGDYYKSIGSEAMFLDIDSFKKYLLGICLNAPHLFTWTLGITTGGGLNVDMNHVCHQTALQYGGSSVRTVLHTLQLFEKGEFRQYDLGEGENKRVYGKYQPPFYNYSKITAPLAIYYSDMDEYAPGNAVRKMFPKFGGKIYSCLVESTHHTEPLMGSLFGKMYNSDLLDVLDSGSGRGGANKDKFNSGKCKPLEEGG